MATPASYLQTAYENACQRLAEMDTVPLGQRARMTYTSKTGQTLDWNAYRRELLQEVKDLPALIQQAAGPWEIYS